MTTYRYKGQTPEGSKVSGVIRAYDEYDAVSKLRDTCAFVIKLEEVREKKDSVLTRPLRTKIKEKDLALICSQFSIILGTGLPVMRCVEMVAAQNRNKHLARMLHKVAEDIGAGYSMAQSFESNIPGLPKTFIETVRAGEQSGALEACFKRLYKYYDKSAKTRAKIVSTMTYPVMVIVTAIIVFAIIMVVAVPAFTSAFAELGTDLPAVTRWLMSTSAFLTRWWWLILFILALLTATCPSSGRSGASWPSRATRCGGRPCGGFTPCTCRGSSPPPCPLCSPPVFRCRRCWASSARSRTTMCSLWASGR